MECLVYRPSPADASDVPPAARRPLVRTSKFASKLENFRARGWPPTRVGGAMGRSATMHASPTSSSIAQHKMEHRLHCLRRGWCGRPTAHVHRAVRAACVRRRPAAVRRRACMRTMRAPPRARDFGTIRFFRILGLEKQCSILTRICTWHLVLNRHSLMLVYLKIS